MRLYYSYFRFIYDQKYFWFMRKPPHYEHPTRIYEGLPGSGKTLMMVRDCIHLMRDDVRVCSNLTIRDPASGRSSEACNSWLEMIEWCLVALKDGKPTVFAFDEIHILLDAREWAKTPMFVRTLLSQHRHYGVGIIGTTQDAGQVEKRLRLLCKHLVQIRPCGLVKWLPFHLKRLPLFSINMMDARLIDVPNVDAAIGRPSLSWMPWYAYHGYSTAELMAAEDMSAYKDDELTERIAKLVEEAQELLSVSEIPAFVDDYSS